MSWTTRAGRFLSFMWKSGTTGAPGFDDAAAQGAIEAAVESAAKVYPELGKAKNAVVKSKPHPTPKADGKIDPLHAAFQITDENNRPITSAHVYPEPLGGRHVWFSKPKYNGNQAANQHYPQNPDNQSKK